METAQSRPVIPWWSTEFGEAEKRAVANAIDGKHISQGKVTRAFEDALAETLGVPYVVCCTSGTTALTMALLACGIGKGDEVIVPNRTWIATAHAVMMTGARVRLVDVEHGSPLMPLEAHAGHQFTNVISALPVNLNGRLAKIPYRNMPEKRGGGEYGGIIEDSCQAFPNPPRGDIACYSLSVAKIISTGQGGFCATRDEALYKEMLALRTHDVADAMVPQVLQWRRWGYNFRFTDIQAAIGLAQLAKLKSRIECLQAVHAEYKAGGIHVEPTPLPLYNEFLCPDPEPLRAHLREHGIEARPIYPSLHTAPYLMPPNKTKYHDYEFPNSAKFASGLILPSGPCQSLTDIRRVCEVIRGYRG